jgi:ACS family hexuronate transporter-like MFS transporter
MAAAPYPGSASLAMPPLLRQVRWRILALLFCITIINFVDRQSLSIVAPLLRESLTLSNTDYGIIVAAFQMGMMLGEFPMGSLMDRFGVRFGFSFAVTWWSIANALHSIARSMLHFSFLRFWLGTGECGNYSGGLKTVSNWFPVRERALAVGIFNSGSMIGSVIAPPLLVMLTLKFG